MSMTTSEGSGRMEGGTVDVTESRDFVTAMAETSPAMLWMGDEQGKCMFLNAALRRFWGVEPASLDEFSWSSTLHPDDVAKLSEPFDKAMAARTPFDVEARYRRADGEWRSMRTLANPRFADDGRFLGMSGVNIDITEQLRAEEHTRLLMSELNHRTKNILSVAQAIARRTVRDVSPEDFIRSFCARLTSLSACNDLLLRTDWSGVGLDELAHAQLCHIAALVGDRLTVRGPAIRVGSREAQTLSMALHELSTNSLKYGALSHETGRVDLIWHQIEPGRWEMQWQETAPVPPAEPDRKGFGHIVMVDMVTAALSAEVVMEFPPTGFVWRMTAAAR